MNEDKLKEMIQAEIDKAEKEEDKAGSSEKAKDDNVEAEISVDDIANQIADKITSAITESKGGNEKDVSQLRDKYFNPKKGFQAIEYPSMDEVKNLNDDEKIVLFFKTLMTKGNDLESDYLFKALVEGTAEDGGNLVPSPLATRVWEILPDMSVMRRNATMIPMTSNTLALNSVSAHPQAYWTNEYASKTTTSAEFSQVSLAAEKLVALLPASHELVADANIDIVQWIINQFARAIAVAEDTAFFTGSGTGRPRGISVESINSKSAGASIDFDDILDLIDLVPQGIAQSSSAAFVAHRNVKRLLRKVKDNDGGYIWRNALGRTSGQTERLPDTLYGYPFFEQNDLSENELYFGDWSYYIIGDRQQITVETTNVGGDAWRRDGTEVKAVERVGGRAVMLNAFAKLQDV